MYSEYLIELPRVARDLMIATIVCMIFLKCRESDEPTSKLLRTGATACLLVAGFAAASVGAPTCAERDDPISGGCSEYDDDGYEVTDKQRFAKGLGFFVLIYAPVVAGALNRKKS